MATNTSLSLLEVRHIAETVHEAIRVVRDEVEVMCGAHMEATDTLIDDLKEVLRILGEDEESNDEE